MRSVAPVWLFTSSEVEVTSPEITLKNESLPKLGSMWDLKINRAACLEESNGISFPVVVNSGLASCGDGATLSMKPIMRPLPMFFFALMQNTGNTS